MDTTDTGDKLEEQLQELLRVGTANAHVAEGLAYFNAASTRIPSPVVTNFAPVQYSTSANSR